MINMYSLHRKVSFHLFLFAIFFANCAVNPKFHSRGEASNPTPAKVKDTPAPPNLINARSLKTIYGRASWYGGKFHGRHTASGEVYDMYAISAAHKELPFHTWVRVTNLKNNKVIVLKVNDRGPFIKGRILDLSYGAAVRLDSVRDGVVDVKIEIVQWGDR